jgi:8-oxo-dGTP pyrophosphatase MutT (NUDIX family)
MRASQWQAAVIPYRVRRERIEVALVTSVSNGDWIVPKGRIEEGERPWEAALREAEEEAGLLGVVERPTLATCAAGNGRGLMRVYAMRVSAVLEHWPEKHIRRRRWMSIAEAAVSVRREFRLLFPALERLLRSRSSAARREPASAAAAPAQVHARRPSFEPRAVGPEPDAERSGRCVRRARGGLIAVNSSGRRRPTTPARG